MEFSEVQLQVIKQTKAYICSLPNGSNLSMVQAIKAVNPEEFERLNTMDFFTLHNEIEKEVNKANTVLDSSDYDGLSVGLPFNVDFYVWHKRLQKIQIQSDLLCYGPAPKPEEPVEQHLTISFAGRVWFTEYLFGRADDNGRKPGRKMQCYIGKGRAARILSYVADYLKSTPLLEFVTDVGSWEMTAYWIDGTKQRLSGSMMGDVTIGNVDLTSLIREEIPIKGLKIFSLDEDD